MGIKVPILTSRKRDVRAGTESGTQIEESRDEENILKRALQIVGLAGTLALLAPLAGCRRRKHTYPAKAEPGVRRSQVRWQRSRTCESKSIWARSVVRGGQQQGINYVVHTRFGTSSEQDARRQFEQYKITAYVKGDTAWIVGDWQGGRQPRQVLRRVFGNGSARNGAESSWKPKAAMWMRPASRAGLRRKAAAAA